MQIAVNCMIKNEDKWVWYAIHSVLPHIDKMVICDTGSSDNTYRILKTIQSPKIVLYQHACSSPSEITHCRQKMFRETNADWVLFLDGDEIWPENAIKETVKILNPHISYVISHYHNLVGDIFHYQPESAGKYQIREKIGNITIRWVNKSLHSHMNWINNYPHEALSIDKKIEIQKDVDLKYVYCDSPYLHATFLKRSSHDSQTLNRKKLPKIELGIRHENKFEFPTSFYFPHDRIVESPWEKRSSIYILNAIWQTPLREINRYLQNK